MKHKGRTNQRPRKSNAERYVGHSGCGVQFLVVKVCTNLTIDGLILLYDHVESGNDYLHANNSEEKRNSAHLDRRVQREMLPGRERLEQRVELRAEAHKTVDFFRVGAHVEPAQMDRARRGRQLACEMKQHSSTGYVLVYGAQVITCAGTCCCKRKPAEKLKTNARIEGVVMHGCDTWFSSNACRNTTKYVYYHSEATPPT